jgi:hypothetical protein
MADKDLLLKCELDGSRSRIALGSGKKDTNQIVLKLSNTSPEPIAFSGPGARGELSIAASIGTRPEDLVKTSQASTAITIHTPDGWQRNPYKNVDGQAIWSSNLPRPAFQAGGTAQITIRNIECNADPGKARIAIRARIAGYKDYSTAIEVEKKSQDFDLLYFTADPPYLITEDDKIKFTLRWNAVQAGRVVLYGNNARLEELEEGTDGTAFTYTKEKPTFTTVYKLVATDKNDETKTREQLLTVQVLAPGWHKVAFPRYGNPSVLCNMDGVKLHGIFIANGNAGLYSSVHPLSGWTLESETVPDRMQTSPAVCFRSRLWLVGGSMADTDVCSNEIWCYNKGEWTKQQQVPWKARMGHACVVFDKKLWVLGGYDESGKSLNEVWAADLNGEQLEWPKDPYSAPWDARCMFAATAFNGKIWIYGGVNQPFGQPFENVWNSGDGVTWQEYTINPPEGKPIGCALQIIRGRLNLIGALKRDYSVVARKCVLSEGQRLWRSSEVPEAAWLDQADNTFSLVSVEYGGVIYLIWQDYKTYSSSGQLYLNVYLP